MTKDITTPEDVRDLVDAFYQRLVVDDVVGHFFTGLDLEHHLPRIHAFWEMVLFGSRDYHADVMGKHVALNQRIRMEQVHFDRWLKLFNTAVDERFHGANADMVKERAHVVAQGMYYKVRATEG